VPGPTLTDSEFVGRIAVFAVSVSQRLSMIITGRLPDTWRATVQHAGLLKLIAALPPQHQ